MIITKPQMKTEKPIPPTKDLGFGKFFSDHMFVCAFEKKTGWGAAKIEPYGPVSMDPGACVFHYAQTLFEGLKAFRGKDGKVRFFRLDYHSKRMAAGAARLCMPYIGETNFVESIRELVRFDKRWVPSELGTALYIRPTLIATEAFLGVRPADAYLYFVITCPVGAYYADGFNPVKIWVEEEYIRAAPGGLGAVKAGANYAASLKSFVEAKTKGYAQVLWLDGVERKYVEEVGTMNVFFRIDGEIVTPPLGGTILNGATRDCVIQILKDWGIKVHERKLSIEEVKQAHAAGKLQEIFGTGTAAVISSVSELACDKFKISVGNGKLGEITQKLYDEITGIQYGEKPDNHGWITEL